MIDFAGHKVFAGRYRYECDCMTERTPPANFEFTHIQRFVWDNSPLLLNPHTLSRLNKYHVDLMKSPRLSDRREACVDHHGEWLVDEVVAVVIEKSIVWSCSGDPVVEVSFRYRGIPVDNSVISTSRLFAHQINTNLYDMVYSFWNRHAGSALFFIFLPQGTGSDGERVYHEP